MHYEIFSYGNIDALSGLFNALAALMGGSVFVSAVALVFVVGFFGSFLAGALAPDRLIGPKWLASVILIYLVLFVPKATVQIVDKTGTAPPAVVDNVPLGLAAQAGLVSSVSNALTDLFETALQVLPPASVLPEEMNFSNHGLTFGANLVHTVSGAMFVDPMLKADIVNFLQNCTFYDISQGYISPTAFATSTDIWSLMSDTNPARFTLVNTHVPPDSLPCPTAYGVINAQMANAVNSIGYKIGVMLNPSLQLNNPMALPGAAALAILAPQVTAAYQRAKIDTAASDAASILRQSAMINSVKYASLLRSQAANDPSAALLGLSEAQATRQMNAQQIVEGEVAKNALPLIRNGIEAMLYGIFPFVLLLAMIFGGTAAFQLLKFYALALIWISIWPPIYAVINYLDLLAWVKNTAAAAYMSDTGLQGLSMQTAAAIDSVAARDLGVVGKLVMSVPMIAGALVFGLNKLANVAAGYSMAISGAASQGAGQAATGNVQMGNVQMDHHNISPSRTDPLTSSYTDASGSYTYRAGEMQAFQQNIGSNAVRLGNSSEIASRFGEASANSQALATEQSQKAMHALDASFNTALANSVSHGTGTHGATGFGHREGAGFDRQFTAVERATEQLRHDLGITDTSSARSALSLTLSMDGKGELADQGSASKDAVISKIKQAIPLGVGARGDQITDNQIRAAVGKAQQSLREAGVSNVDKLMHDYVKSDDFKRFASTNREEADRIEAGLRESDSLQGSASKNLRQSQEYRATAENLKSAALRGEVDWTPEFNRYLVQHGAIGPGQPSLGGQDTVEWANKFFRESGLGVGADGKPAAVLYNGGNNVTVTPGSYRDPQVLKARYEQQSLRVDGQPGPTTESGLRGKHAGDRGQVADRGTGPTAGVPTSEAELQAALEAQKKRAAGRLDQGQDVVDRSRGARSAEFNEAAENTNWSQNLGAQPDGRSAKQQLDKAREQSQ